MPVNPTNRSQKSETFPLFQSQLFSKKEFVNLNDLLPNNRTPHASSSSKSNASKTEQIRDHHQWSRAFNVLKMYRCAIYPELWLPMTKYMDHIAQTAALKGITPEQWLAYDRQFRLAICRNPDDVMQWSPLNTDTSGRNVHCCVALPAVAGLHGLGSPFLTSPPVTGDLNLTKSASCGIKDNVPPDCSADTAVNIGVQTAVNVNIESRSAKQKCTAVIPKTIVTPLKADAFAHFLKEHPDQQFVSYLLNILRHGADIGYRGPKRSMRTPNAASARTYATHLQTQIDAEVSLIHSVGPFSSPPFPTFVNNFLGVRPKPDGKFRILMDMSRPTGQSVNDYISKEDYSLAFCNVDDAVKLLLQLGKGALMSKFDIQHAFRLVSVRPADWHLLGYQCNGLFYFDIVLPFGSRSPPFIFCLISDAVHWVFVHVTGHKFMLHYVDDFFLATHSAAANATSHHDIQRAGRWTSNAYTSYIRTEVPLTGISFYPKD
ncbi:uncharacterized protein LOC129582904 [Paramacrobiotus metropolitanus]|uniref:uncharacterized protein LOC129582904 n=1 Tax=Paramacrobiotus metropolitanus TaxID=2943436 RepID=UPI00244623F4|nr:uncharacterized protein LOC129582904 [Paramacrobiotus metropolitanus]